MFKTPDFSSNNEDKVTTDEPVKKVRKTPKKKMKKVVKEETKSTLEDFIN